MDARTRSWLLGLGSGVVATMAFPIVVPIARELARPVAKALLRRQAQLCATNFSKSSRSLGRSGHVIHEVRSRWLADRTLSADRTALGA